MNKMITEDIIKRALDESIEEFMLEEGAFSGLKNWWNTSQNAQKIKNAGNSLWNGVKMYMDYRTNGQWNNKYNQHATGKGATIGSYYVSKWFETHYKKLQNIVYGDNYGNMPNFYCSFDNKQINFNFNWKNRTYALNYNGYTYSFNLDMNNNPNKLTIYNRNGYVIKTSKEIKKSSNDSYFVIFNSTSLPNDFYIYIDNSNDSPEEYVSKYCTTNSFKQYTRSTLQDGDFKTAILCYIEEMIQGINEINKQKLENNPDAEINYNELIKLFTLQSFYEWFNKNRKRFSNNNQSQQQQTQQQQGQQQQAQQQQGQQQQTQQQQGHTVSGKKDKNYTGGKVIDILNGGMF